MTDYTDGRWIAMSVGQFCQILIDSGENEAILFRVIQPDEQVTATSFVREYQMFQVPSGAVKDYIEATHAATHKVLDGFLERGLIT